MATLVEDLPKNLEVNTRVVAITLYGAGRFWERCITSIVNITEEKVPICIFEDGYPTDESIEKTREFLAKHSSERVVYLHRNSENLGLVKNLNVAFSKLAPADVVVLNSDIIVGPHWLSNMEKGLEDPTIATITPFSSDATIFTINSAAKMLGKNPEIEEVEELAKQIAHNKPLFPEVPTCVAFCTLFTRRALENVGNFDEIFSPGYGEENDFSMRALSLGFRHIGADQVFVFHAHGDTFGRSQAIKEMKLLHDVEVEKRYPYFRELVRNIDLNPDSALNIAKHRAEITIRGLNILVWGNKLDPNLTGTFKGLLGLVRQLGESKAVRNIDIAVARTKVSEALALITKYQIRARIVEWNGAYTENYDIGLVPHQVFNDDFLDSMKEKCRRTIIWHLDFIAQQIPEYATSFQSFLDLRDSISKSLERSDGVIFLTSSGRILTKSKGIAIDERRITELAPYFSEDFERKGGSHSHLELPDKYLLVLGISYLHKNRRFAQRVFRELKEEFPELNLLFAGPGVRFGHDQVELSDREQDLGKVTDEIRDALIEGAELVLCPSVVEGFGLVPLEVAALGSTPITSQTMGYSIHKEIPFQLSLESVSKSAETIKFLLRKDEEMGRQYRAWQEALQEFNNEKQARRFVEFALEIVSMPPRVRSSEIVPRVKLAVSESPPKKSRGIASFVRSKPLLHSSLRLLARLVKLR